MEYAKPQGSKQPALDGANIAKLTDREQAAYNATISAARELGRVLGHERREFFTATMPEMILRVLESHDPQAARLAAKEYLEQSER